MLHSISKHFGKLPSCPREYFKKIIDVRRIHKKVFVMLQYTQSLHTGAFLAFS